MRAGAHERRTFRDARFRRDAVGAAIFLGSAMFGGPAFPDECPLVGEQRMVITGISSHDELDLADGRVLRLAGFDPALATPHTPDLGERTRSALGTKLVGRTVAFRLLSQHADRWGRFPAFVTLGDTRDASGGVAASALAAGLGRYLAEPAAHACRAALLQAETLARQAKLGLWADPYYGVLAIEDRLGFTERAGTVVLAEGVVAAVQPSPFRTTLRFVVAEQGSRSGHMLVATISPNVLKSFRAQQMDMSRLVGRRVRLRGLLDVRFGPRIELNGPDDLEVLGEPGDGAPKPSAN